jgi:RHS repeat-associated protein
LAVTNYHTINGQIIGESTGGTLTSYLPDALGSVIATAKAGAIKNTYRTTPYGTTTVKTGADPDPRYVYNGTWGYRKTAMPYVDHHIRYRHHEGFTGRWTTMDPLWPHEHPYSYVNGEPIDWIDPWGLVGVTHLHPKVIVHSGGTVLHGPILSVSGGAELAPAVNWPLLGKEAEACGTLAVAEPGLGTVVGVTLFSILVMNEMGRALSHNSLTREDCLELNEKPPSTKGYKFKCLAVEKDFDLKHNKCRPDMGCEELLALIKGYHECAFWRQRFADECVRQYFSYMLKKDPGGRGHQFPIDQWRKFGFECLSMTRGKNCFSNQPPTYDGAGTSGGWTGGPARVR